MVNGRVDTSRGVGAEMVRRIVGWIIKRNSWMSRSVNKIPWLGE